MDFVNYYKILQLPHTANQDDIKTAYRQLAKTMHPDKNPEDNQATLNFQNLNDAYSTLSDLRKRRVYDIAYERHTRPSPPPYSTEPKSVDRHQVEQFIRQFNSCVSKAVQQVIIQKRRIEQEQEALRALEDEILTAGFEMIEIYECDAGPSNLERTKEYPQIQAQERLKATLEANLKEEEEKLAGLEGQVLEFNRRLSYRENKLNVFYGESYS
ncbi:molecular chaperone [Fusarium coicis]|nr:molecular chaperone [Fusarium coicis]